ncbi:hypothetical protein OA88_11075 [Flavobacterium sp. JRM]|nr:hypothetical protein OA88_11075 [Flavobacterium sp. JRM]
MVRVNKNKRLYSILKIRLPTSRFGILTHKKMKLKLTLLFLTLSISAFAQTNLGIGLIAIKFNDKTVLPFYSSINDKQPIKTIRFFNDETINSWNIQDLKNQQKWLKPEILWLDYNFFIFRCEKQEKDWFKIIVDNESGKSLWIKKSKNTEFRDWEKYLQDMFRISRKSKADKIYKLPNTNSGTIKYLGEECFQVKSMKGDWIEIFTSECDDVKSEIKSGWIKWKNGNTLLIECFPIS